MLEIRNVQISAERMPMPISSDIFLNLSDGKEMASYLIYVNTLFINNDVS